MKNNCLIAFTALTALGIASAVPAQQSDRGDREQRSPSQTSAGSSTQGYSDRYGILEKNNIFVRDRSRAAPRTNPSSTTQPLRRSLEESLVLRGIAMEELGYRAYVEDLNNGTTLRVSPGDPLGRGHVTSIALDAIRHEQDGKQRWIDIGSDLTGKQSGTSSPYAAATATTSPTTLPANIDLNDPNLTTEQRMRLRVQLQNQRGR